MLVRWNHSRSAPYLIQGSMMPQLSGVIYNLYSNGLSLRTQVSQASTFAVTDQHLSTGRKPTFFLFSQNVTEEGSSTWNFFEASHGKGALDCVGDEVKRTADLLVSQGTDIPDAKTIYDNRFIRRVKLFYVSNEEVSEAVQHQNFSPLASVPGKIATHQVISDVAGEIWYREVGCVCSLSVDSAKCDCFPFQGVQIPELPPSRL